MKTTGPARMLTFEEHRAMPEVIAVQQSMQDLDATAR